MPPDGSPPSYGSHHFGGSHTSSPSKVIAQSLLARYWQLNRSLQYKFIRWHLVTEAGLRAFLAKSDHFWELRSSISLCFFLCSVASSPLRVIQAPFAQFQNTYSWVIPYFEYRIFQTPSALPTTKNVAMSDHDYTAGGFWTGMIALLFAMAYTSTPESPPTRTQ